MRRHIVLASDDATTTATPQDSPSPKQPAPQAVPSDTPVSGLACSQASAPLDVETPNDENWQTPDYDLVSEPVDETLLVDVGVVCSVQSTVEGDVVVEGPGKLSMAAFVPGGVVSVTGTQRVVVMEPDAEFCGVESDPDAQPPLVLGDVASQECSSVALVAGTVDGSVTIMDKPGGSLLVTDMAIGADLTQTSSSGFGGDRDGTTKEPPPLTGNTVGGSVTLTDNYGRPLLVEGNTITGDLACEGNIPAPEGGDNVVNGTVSGQCSALWEPYSCSLATEMLGRSK